MKLSTFQLVLLTAFGALAVAAVLIFALAIGGGGGSNVGSVTIWGTFDETAVKSVIRAAADTDDRLIQVNYVQKDPATYEQDLVDALASGTGPDLFFLSDDWALHDAAKTIHIPYSSLSQSQFQNTFLDAAAPFLAEDGVVAIPLIADPLVLYWNRDLLSQAGFTDPPHYWDELFTFAPKLTKKSDSGTIQKATIALGEYENIANAKDILATLMLQAGSPITARDSAGKLVAAIAPQNTGSATQQASLSALRFYTEFADPSADYYAWSRALPEARAAFAQGNLALYVGHASEKTLIKQANPNLNFSVAPIPQVRNDQKLPVDTARVYALAIPRTSTNPQGGRTVAYILAAPTISQGFATVLGVSSALRSVVSASGQPAPSTTTPRTSLDQLLAQSTRSDVDLFNSQSAIARSWIDPDPPKTSDIFRAMIEDTVSGAQKINDALLRADKQMSQLLGL